MSANVRDRVAGAALVVVALVWLLLVYLTIEPGQGTAAGPRAFPLIFGYALLGLSLILLLQAFLGSSDSSGGEAQGSPRGDDLYSVVATIGSIVIYGAVLEPLGFIPATTLVVAGMMILVLRIYSPIRIAAVSLGLALGCYVVFGKLLGTYLPPGTVVPIYL
jgi:putative tricarboxylic transport membrane protein